MRAWTEGWDWAWMAVLAAGWAIVIAAAAYRAVRLANRPPADGGRS